MKTWFAFSIFMLMFSSVMTFLYFLALFVSPFIMIPGVSKELMYMGIVTGLFIGWLMMYFSIKSLWKNGNKVKIIKNTLDSPPLNKPEFDKLLDEIKTTNIGPDMMNHVKECQMCTEMSIALNKQVNKHIEDISKHQ